MNAPFDDPSWLEIYNFLTHTVKESEFILSPDGFKTCFEPHQLHNYRSTYFLEATDFDWAILHKGMLKKVSANVLDTIDASFTPVFANAVFVVFCKEGGRLKPIGRRSPHLQSYYKQRRLLAQTNDSSDAASVPSGQSNEAQSLEESARFKKFLRSADVLICSYPKCGRTWIRFMLACYMDRLSGSTEPMTLERMNRIIPAAHKSMHKDDIAILSRSHGQTSSGAPIPLLAATHINYSNRQARIIFSDKDIIFVLRTIYDVLVSQYFELVYRRGLPDTQRVWEFIQREHLLESLVSYFNSWSRHLPCHRHITLTYENLKHDAHRELRAIVEFLKLDINPTFLQEAVDMSSFQNMQQLQRERYGVDDSHDGVSSLRVRKGKIGGYRDYLNADEIQAIQQYCQTKLNKAATALFETHGLTL